MKSRLRECVSVLVLFVALLGPAWWLTHHSFPDRPGATWIQWALDAVVVAIATAVIASAAYGFRISHRQHYGVVEIGVGIIVSVAGIVRYLTDEGNPNSVQSLSVSHATVALLGAVYIMVRGLDNIAQSLPEKKAKNWNKWWRSVPFVALSKRRNNVSSAAIEAAPASTVKDLPAGSPASEPVQISESVME
jgi:hypothetical protein